jgi:hypothetical protein
MQLMLLQGGVAVGLYFLLTLVFKVRALVSKLHSLYSGIWLHRLPVAVTSIAHLAMCRFPLVCSA